MTGGNLAVTNYIYDGYSGVGYFSQTGGTNSASTLYIGYASTGTYILSGNALLSAPRQFVGNYGTGYFTQSGGTNSVSAELHLGSKANSNGTYTLKDSGLLSAASEFVGDFGNGTFTQSGGTNSIPSGTLTLGNNSGGSGTYNLNGGLLNIGGLSTGDGTAVFNFNGGTFMAGNSFSISLPIALGTSGGGATFDTGGNTLTLSGSLSGAGSLTKTNYGTLLLNVANTYSGNTLISQDTLELGNSLAMQNSTLDTSCTGVLSFGSLRSATLGGLTGPGTLTLTNTNIASVALSVGNNNTNTTFSGTLKGLGSLTKVNSGSLSLSGTNSYSGSTTVSGGTLEASSINALPGYGANGRLSVANGATLAIGVGGSGWSSTQIDTLLGNYNAFNTGSFLAFDTTALSFTYSSVIGTNLSGLGVSKLDTNSLTLSGNNTYGGGTCVTAGTLQLGNTNALGSSTGSVALYAGVLDLAGFSPTIGALSGTAGSTITNSLATAATLTTSVASGTSTFAGVITDDGTVGLTKSGAGLLILSGANAYSGGTSIGGGTLQLGDSSALGTGWVAIYAGALDLAGFSTTIGALSGTTGSTITNSLATASTLTTNFAGTSTFAGLITDGGVGKTVALTKGGAGTLILSTSNTYTAAPSSTTARWWWPTQTAGPRARATSP